MGLGAPKKRLKLSQDPNNTAWSRDTTTFGHKILTSQGWAPGQYLGAKDANHAGHYTAANASHIRAVLREDNLGLGAKIGSGNAENFGLSMLSGLLGRLNGKSDEVLQKQEAAMRDVELRTYQAQKYGFMNFVSGGFLVGDKMEIKSDANPSSATINDRKRKRDDQKAAAEPEVVPSKPAKSKKTRKTVSTVEAELSEESVCEESKSRDDSKAKRRLGKAERRAKREATASDDTSSVDEKTKLKAEKRARKEEKRKRKEEKQRLKNEKQKELVAVKSEAATTSTDEPVKPAISAQPNLSRHAVRQRYIQQKRMASMNPQALKEIFMIQAAS